MIVHFAPQPVAALTKRNSWHGPSMRLFCDRRKAPADESTTVVKAVTCERCKELLKQLGRQPS